MRSQGAAAACITDPTSIAYLTGFSANPHERLLALAVGPDSALLVVPDLEREHAERHAKGTEIVSWQDGEDPFRLLRGALGDPARLAVEKEHLTIARWELLDAGEIEDCSAALRAMRAIKQPVEVDLLQAAAQLTDEVTSAILGELRAATGPLFDTGRS